LPKSSAIKRKDGRPADQIRPLKLTRSFGSAAIGSVLAESGDTRVLCTVSYQDQVPTWMTNQRGAWITAEYSMLPGSTMPRKQRERNTKVDGRSLEIGRLIGRSLRCAVDLKKLPELTLWIDCDVIAADGGTRTTAINGAFVALYDALLWLENKKIIRHWPLLYGVSAISVGLVDGMPLLDLDFQEDARADVDMTVVCTDDGRFVEVQGAAERTPFDPEQLTRLLDLGRAGNASVQAAQKAALGLN
jgi:ribonuclease PH